MRCLAQRSQSSNKVFCVKVSIDKIVVQIMSRIRSDLDKKVGPITLMRLQTLVLIAYLVAYHLRDEIDNGCAN